MLKNANGMYCYRYTLQGRWQLRSEFKPEEHQCSAYIATKEGPLPVGAHTWKCKTGGQWQDHTLTVTLQ